MQFRTPKIPLNIKQNLKHEIKSKVFALLHYLFYVDANTGDAFSIFMASISSLRTSCPGACGLGC